MGERSEWAGRVSDVQRRSLAGNEVPTAAPQSDVRRAIPDATANAAGDDEAAPHAKRLRPSVQGRRRLGHQITRAD